MTYLINQLVSPKFSYTLYLIEKCMEILSLMYLLHSMKPYVVCGEIPYRVLSEGFNILDVSL
jgi:hypothetical protein